jgi:hypothetical protein
MAPTISPVSLQSVSFASSNSSAGSQSSHQALFQSTPGNLSATPVIGVLVPVFALAYICGLLWMYRYAAGHPRALNKCVGVKVQKLAPAAHAAAVLVALTELALAIWLLIQYPALSEPPNAETYAAVRLLLFGSVWTILTAACFSMFLLHPTLSTHPSASVGSQLVWALVSLAFWIAGAITISVGVTGLLPRNGGSDSSMCGHTDINQDFGVQVCSVERGLFALAIIQIALLAINFFLVCWVARESITQDLRPLSYAPSARTQSFQLSGYISSRNTDSITPGEQSTTSQRVLSFLNFVTAPISRISRSTWWRQAA